MCTRWIGNIEENLGIDLPDEVFALAPYSTEMDLGMKLLFDLASVNRKDFKQVLKSTDKARLGAVKACNSTGSEVWHQ